MGPRNLNNGNVHTALVTTHSTQQAREHSFLIQVSGLSSCLRAPHLRHKEFFRSYRHLFYVFHILINNYNVHVTGLHVHERLFSLEVQTLARKLIFLKTTFPLIKDTVWLLGFSKISINF